MVRYILAWFPMIIIGVLNGTFREMTYGKHLSQLHAHQVSTATGILLFGLYIFTVISWFGIESSQQAIAIGCIWLGLTIGFEFLFGHYIAGHTWNQLFADYNLLAGRVWLLVLLWITFSPLVFYRLLS